MEMGGDPGRDYAARPILCGVMGRGTVRADEQKQ